MALPAPVPQRTRTCWSSRWRPSRSRRGRRRSRQTSHQRGRSGHRPGRAAGAAARSPSRLRRDPSVFTAVRPGDEEYLVTPSFTLQWHITQVCDLHCRHCYDRSDRSPLSYDEAVRVLDDLRIFCRDRNVQGAVSFTGGNPLLHPRFDDIYRAAVERNFSTAILGNPAPKERIARIVDMGMPAFSR